MRRAPYKSSVKTGPRANDAHAQQLYPTTTIRSGCFAMNLNEKLVTKTGNYGGKQIIVALLFISWMRGEVESIEKHLTIMTECLSHIPSHQNIFGNLPKKPRRGECLFFVVVICFLITSIETTFFLLPVDTEIFSSTQLKSGPVLSSRQRFSPLMKYFCCANWKYCQTND